VAGIVGTDVDGDGIPLQAPDEGRRGVLTPIPIASSITPDWSKTDGSLLGFKRRVGNNDIPLKTEEVVYFWLPDPW